MCWSRTIYNRMAGTVGIRQPCCIHKVALKSRFQTSDGVNQGAAWSSAATQLRHPPDCFCLREEQGLPPQLKANHQCPCDQISLTRPCAANHRYSLLCLLCGPAGLQLNWDGAKYISSLFVFLILPTSFSVESVPIPCCWSDWAGCRMRAWLVVIHSILRLLWLISPAWLKQDGVPLIWQNE